MLRTPRSPSRRCAELDLAFVEVARRPVVNEVDDEVGFVVADLGVADDKTEVVAEHGWITVGDVSQIASSVVGNREFDAVERFEQSCD